jgi:hypothetical protein
LKNIIIILVKHINVLPLKIKEEKDKLRFNIKDLRKRYGEKATNLIKITA